MLAPQVVEDVPVALLPFDAEQVEQMALEIGDDRVVVEQRVVDVDQVDEILHGRIVGTRDRRLLLPSYLLLTPFRRTLMLVSAAFPPDRR